MHLVSLSEPCPFPFENPTQVLPKEQTLLCTTDVVKLLCFADSHMEIRPYRGPIIHSLDEIDLEKPFSVMIQGSLIDHLLIWQQLHSQARFNQCKLYTHHDNATFFNELLNTSRFLPLPQVEDSVIYPYLYKSPLTFHPDQLNHCRDWLNANQALKTRPLPQKDQMRVALGLQAYKDPQALNKPLVRELMNHLSERERLIFWNHHDVDFIYPDHLAHQFDNSMKFTIQEAVELLKNADLYIGPYNHWMCLALIFGIPILALSHDQEVIGWLKEYPQGTYLPKTKSENPTSTCCRLCGNLESKIACKPFCKKMETLSIDQITDSLFFFFETSLWPL